MNGHNNIFIVHSPSSCVLHLISIQNLLFQNIMHLDFHLFFNILAHLFIYCCILHNINQVISLSKIWFSSDYIRLSYMYWFKVPAFQYSILNKNIDDLLTSKMARVLIARTTHLSNTFSWALQDGVNKSWL